MRHIKSSRLGSTGDHSHYCPLIGARIDKTGCDLCEHLDSQKHNVASYEVFCKAPMDNTLFQFDPMKAYDKEALPSYFGDPMTNLTMIVIEPKRDGARAFLHLTAEGIRVTTRRKRQDGTYGEITDNFPHMKDTVVPEHLIDTILDTEGMVMPEGASASGNISTGTLGATMSVFGSQPAKAIATQQKNGWMHFYCHSIVRYSGQDLRDKSDADRRDYLEEVLADWDNEYVHLTDRYTTTDPAERRALYQEFLKTPGFEGAVLKNPNAKYGATYGWVKIKENVTIDALVTGFEYGKKGGKYADTVGTLLISVIDQKTGKLREVGKVVPGADSTRAKLLNIIKALENQGRQIIDAKILVEVEAQNYTKQYRMRHPKLKRYRNDKTDITVVDFTQIERK